MPTVVCTAKASYKKLPGVLQLTDEHLQWTQDGKLTATLRVPRSEAASLFCSKEGAAQVRLKLGVSSDENAHNFTFTSPPPTAYSEREKFKAELTAIISRNRSVQDAPKPSVTPAPIAAANSSNNAQSVKSANISSARPSTSRAASVSSDRRSTPVIAGNDPVNDFRLRKKVLISNPELGTLHRDLVMSGQITEAEFWDGREHLLLAEAAAENQKKGRSGQLVDPRPEAVEGGEIKIRITPQLVHDIFDEYPVVAKAYSENVPENLTEEGFWRRYFQSRLFHAHRASIRSSATQAVVKDDPIFDKYLEKDDDAPEPRRQRDDVVDLFVDLGATQEDHDMTGNEKDHTMQAGKQKGVLPLIRKFNEHSERLLNSALGEFQPAVKRRRLDSGREDYSEIELSDLNDCSATAGIALEMQDRERYFEGRMSSTAASDALQGVPRSTVVQAARTSTQDWNNSLIQAKLERKAGDSALLSMTQNVAARLDVKSRKNEIPDGLFRQMTTCQTAANEFLRQFWLAMYPMSQDLQTVAVATPAQRMTKAAKMIGYIAKTPEKINALIKTARASGIDASRVETALMPVLDAVNQALEFYRRKVPPRP